MRCEDGERDGGSGGENGREEQDCSRTRDALKSERKQRDENGRENDPRREREAEKECGGDAVCERAVEVSDKKPESDGNVEEVGEVVAAGYKVVEVGR